MEAQHSFLPRLRWLSSKEAFCNVRDVAGAVGSIPGLGRSPGEGNGNPLQYSCLKNPMDRGAWRATVHGVTKKVGHSLVTKQQRLSKRPTITHTRL